MARENPCRECIHGYRCLDADRGLPCNMFEGQEPRKGKVHGKGTEDRIPGKKDGHGADAGTAENGMGSMEDMEP